MEENYEYTLKGGKIVDKSIYQSGRLYLWDEKVAKYRWVVNPVVAIKVWGKDWEKQPRKYPEGVNWVSKTGDPITEWPENNEPEPEPNGNGHKTDRLYKMLYVCPSHTNQFDWLDKIKEVGFNTIHTYNPFQWESEGWWEGAGETECLNSIRNLLIGLKDRNMYGCLQVPHGTSHLKHTAQLMKDFGNAIASTVEEPDLHIPPSPSFNGQQRLYDISKKEAPKLQVWGCFNGGQWPVCMNVDAYDLIMTDSYPYQRENGPVPGTQAAVANDISLPWWKLNPWIHDRKIPMMKQVLPKDMPLIIIQQGMYNTGEGHVLPNVEEEWEVYNKEFGTNSFAIYPHGDGQGMDGVYVMNDDEGAEYGLKNQCRALMKKLDMGGR